MFQGEKARKCSEAFKNFSFTSLEKKGLLSLRERE